MWDSAGEARLNSLETFCHGHLLMDAPVLAERQKLNYISSVRTLDTVWRTCSGRWMIGTDGERVREIDIVRII